MRVQKIEMHFFIEFLLFDFTFIHTLQKMRSLKYVVHLKKQNDFYFTGLIIKKEANNLKIQSSFAKALWACENRVFEEANILVLYVVFLLCLFFSCMQHLHRSPFSCYIVTHISFSSKQYSRALFLHVRERLKGLC